MSEISTLQTKLIQVGQAFRPGAPVDTADLFAGRIKQMNELIQAIGEPYTHAIVFGERGVGKTSLVTVVGGMLSQIVKASGGNGGMRVIRENCSANDSFTSVWRRALKRCPFRPLVSREVGFNAGTDTVGIISGDDLLPRGDLEAGDIANVLRMASEHLVFIFDEFDRVDDRNVANPMADALKAMSDHHINATAVIVGVGDSVTEIMSAHRSVERCVRQIHMPRMADGESFEILTKGAKIGQMNFESLAAATIVNIARGFPHYVHLLGSEGMKLAVLRHASEVSFEHLASSLDSAMARSLRSLSDSYVKATQSPRRDALHRHVLLACSLAKTDDQGYFRPADIQDVVARILVRTKVATGTFAGHLSEFSTEKRGQVLKKIGADRNYRYRFTDPLMIPYVLVRGLQSSMITPEDLGVTLPAS